MVKRFVVFFGRDDRPSGGWYDFSDSFDTREEATQHLTLIGQLDVGNEWWQIVDLKKGEVQIGRFEK